MASKDGQILPQKEAAVFKTIVVGIAAARFAGEWRLLQMCLQPLWRAQCVRACLARIRSLTGPHLGLYMAEILRDKAVQKGTKIGGLHSQEVSRTW